MRICLLGLPRTGSQHIAELIYRNYDDMIDLREPFNPWENKLSVELVNNKVRLNRAIPFKSLGERVTQVLEAIDGADKEQNIILRLFLLNYPEYNVLSFFPKIIDKLKKNDFKFFAVTRNVNDQLLSYAISISSNVWNSTEGTHDSNKKYKVTDFKSISKLHYAITEFQNRLQNLDCDYKIIRYEHAEEDLKLLCGLSIDHIKPKFWLEKQITGSHYDFIENKEEVKNFIKTLTNGTQIY